MPPKTFKFKLESVLEHKKKIEEEEQRELARLKEILRQAQERLEDLKMTKVQEMKELVEKSSQGLLNVAEIQMYHSHLKRLDKEIASQEIAVQRAAVNVEEQRQKLIRASQEKKTYEKLKEKHKTVFELALEEEERKFIDELATMRYDASRALTVCDRYDGEVKAF